MIYLLYGQSGSGKTTLGNLLADHLNTPFVIDGDEFRSYFTNRDYGFGGRKKNIRSANAVATYLNKKSQQDEWVAIYCKSNGGNSIQGRPVKKGTDVVMCLVNPYEQFRNELKEDNAGQVTEIMLISGRPLKKEYHVKDFEKGSPDYIINTDQELEDCWGYVKDLLEI
jgi:hypothetical protein